MKKYLLADGDSQRVMLVGTMLRPTLNGAGKDCRLERNGNLPLGEAYKTRSILGEKMNFWSVMMLIMMAPVAKISENLRFLIVADLP